MKSNLNRMQFSELPLFSILLTFLPVLLFLRMIISSEAVHAVEWYCTKPVYVRTEFDPAVQHSQAFFLSNNDDELTAQIPELTATAESGEMIHLHLPQTMSWAQWVNVCYALPSSEYVFFEDTASGFYFKRHQNGQPIFHIACKGAHKPLKHLQLKCCHRNEEDLPQESDTSINKIQLVLFFALIVFIHLLSIASRFLKTCSFLFQRRSGVRANFGHPKTKRISL